MTFYQKLHRLLNVNQAAIQVSEVAIQEQFAGQLRALAIQHLRYGQGVVANSFRGEYLGSGLGSYEDFLNTQSRDTVWGSYIEATALAEKLGCHLVVTPVKGQVEQKPLCLYRAADEKAPVIHLYNSNNTHWYLNHKTQGNGNCLYNAFAQALQTVVKEELRSEAPTLVSSSKSSLFAASEESKHQQEIFSIIKTHPTPQELEVELQAEQERMSKLPLAEREQIAADYQLALQLAREEMQHSTQQASFPTKACRFALNTSEPAAASIPAFNV
jgi:hypothetical protein